jgi:hypothetical protein
MGAKSENIEQVHSAPRLPLAMPPALYEAGDVGLGRQRIRSDWVRIRTRRDSACYNTGLHITVSRDKDDWALARQTRERVEPSHAWQTIVHQQTSGSIIGTSE